MVHNKIVEMTGMPHSRAVKGSPFEHDPHGGHKNPVVEAEKEAEKIGKRKMNY
jgi:hypothetical protein